MPTLYDEEAIKAAAGKAKADMSTKDMSQAFSED
jgi:hypothetical protein